MKRLRRTIFLMGIFVVCAIFLELGSRLFLRFSSNQVRNPRSLQTERKNRLNELAPKLTRESLIATHPYLGYVFNPHSSEFEGKRVSKYGFMNSTDALPKRSPEKLMVGIFGGSVAYYLGARAESLLKRELAQIPRFKGKEVVLFNAALGGYKEPQQLFALTYLLTLGAEFDLVINLDGFNEVALDNAENRNQKVASIYPRSWYWMSGKENRREPKAELLLHSIEKLKEKQFAWATNFEKVKVPSNFTSLLWKAGDHYLWNKIWKEELKLNSFFPSDKMTYSVKGPESENASFEGRLTELVATWERASLLLHNLCRANDIFYFHFLQPNQYQPGGAKVMSEAEKAKAYLPNHPYKLGTEKGYPLLVKAGENLRERGVQFHNLTSIFQTYSEPLFEDTCCHLNLRGNELLAAKIVDTIRLATENSRHPIL